MRPWHINVIQLALWYSLCHNPFKVTSLTICVSVVERRISVRKVVGSFPIWARIFSEFLVSACFFIYIFVAICFIAEARFPYELGFFLSFFFLHDFLYIFVAICFIAEATMSRPVSVCPYEWTRTRYFIYNITFWMFVVVSYVAQ